MAKTPSPRIIFVQRQGGNKVAVSVGRQIRAQLHKTETGLLKVSLTIGRDYFPCLVCHVTINHKLNCQSNSSHSQRRDAPSEGQWRQREHEQRQSESKAQVGEVEKERQRPRQHEEGTVPKGTCQTMCPARELRNREAQNRLHHFEMLPGTERDRRPKGDPSRAVKEYSRPAAGKDATKPSDLRPPPVLLKTVNYLIDDIAAGPSLHQWTEASDTYTNLSYLFS